MAKATKIRPPPISKYFDGMFFTKFPLQKPQTDIKNDATPIIKTESNNDVCVKRIDAPDTNASILVANPKPKRHLSPIHCTSSSFGWKDSTINFNPKIRKMPKTIHLL